MSAELPVNKVQMHEELCSTMSQGHCRNWRKYLWLPLVLFSTSYLSSPTFPPCMQTTASAHHTALAVICSLFFAIPPFFFSSYRQWPRKRLGATTSDRRWRMAFCCVSKYSACIRQLSSTSYSCSCLLSWGSGLWCKCCWYFPDGPPAGSFCVFVIHLKWRDSRGCFMQWLSEWDLPSVLGLNHMKCNLF